MATPITNLDQVVETAKQRGPFTVVLAEGHDPAALAALAMASEQGIARAVLVGDPGKIGPALEALEGSIEDKEIADADGEEASVAKAVDIVRNGNGQILLKGKVQTGTLLKGVLDRDGGLRAGSLLSDAFLFEYPGDSGTRLVCITDGGINIAPDLNAKRQILENAAALYHALGHERPKVSVLSAVEKAVPDHAPSDDALALAEMAKKGDIRGCDVEGPLSLDLSISPMAVAKKGHEGPVAGRADILLCPEFISANLLAKSTTYFARYRLAHVIMGASAPVLIPSRSDTPEAKFLSIALGAMRVS